MVFGFRCRSESMEIPKSSKLLLVGAIAVSLAICWKGEHAFAKKKSGKNYPVIRKVILLPGRPTAMAMSPDNRRLAVLHPEGLSLVDLESQSISKTTPAPFKSDFPDVLFNPEGAELYFSNHDTEILRLLVAAGASDQKLEPLISFREQRSEKPGIGGLALSPNGRYLVMAMSRANQLKVFDLFQPIKVVLTLRIESPQGVLFSRDGLELFVGQPCIEGKPLISSTSTAVGDKQPCADKDGFVSIIDLKQGKLREQISVGSHTGRLCLSKDGTRLFVAGSEGNSVTCVNVETEELAEVISLESIRGSRSAMTPVSVCLAPDGKRLFAAIADASLIAIVALGSPSAKSLKSEPSKVEGLIPVPGKPQALAFDRDGTKLLVALNEPVDWSAPQPSAFQSLGAVAIIDLPTVKEWSSWLEAYRKSHS
jgi:DNA-binding beta-propeller fold protein YncE